jgi:hypothetical protein
MKYSKEQIESAEKALRDVLKPGDTVRVILRHCSRSGMTRSISPIIHSEDYSWAVARLLGHPFDRTNGGVKMGGCGMDMGFELVYQLSRTLYRGGFGCIGEGCPSNDHSNGDRDYTPYDDGTPKNSAEVGTDIPGKRINRHYHADGGYALRHKWL